MLGGTAGLGGLAALLQKGGTVTPEQAQEVSPEAVQVLAQKASQTNPSIVDKASQFYAQHPALVKSIGAGALALLMSISRDEQSTEIDTLEAARCHVPA